MISGNKENKSTNIASSEMGRGEKRESEYPSHHHEKHGTHGHKHEEHPMHNEVSSGQQMEGAARVFENPMKEYFMMADQLSRIFALMMGLKFKIFDSIDELGDKSDTQSILKKSNFNTSSRHMMDLLDQLYIHGILTREGNMENAVYKNTEYSKKYLMRKSSDNYDDVYLNLFRYIKKFESLETGFSSGLTKIFSDDISCNEEDLYSYMAYYYKVNRFNFDFILSNFDFNKYKRVIDIHGLCGTIAMKIKSKFQNCEVISYENSKLKDMIKNYNKKEQIPEGTIKFEYGDLMKDKLPECDCVIMPHILMHFSKDNREKILKMIYDCLKPDGEIIIMENLVDSERSKDSHGLRISFMLGLLGYEGYVMSYEEYKDIISSIGFKNIDRISKGQGVSDFICAKK